MPDPVKSVETLLPKEMSGDPFAEADRPPTRPCRRELPQTVSGVAPQASRYPLSTDMAAARTGSENTFSIPQNIRSPVADISIIAVAFDQRKIALNSMATPYSRAKIHDSSVAMVA